MRRVPLPFVLALAGGAAASCVLALARALTRRDPGDLHSGLADLVTGATQGLAIAIGVLLLAGTFALRARDPARPVGLLLVGATVLLAAAIARPICELFLLDRLGDYLAVLDGRRWLGRADTTGAVAFALGLVALGEHTDGVRNLTVPLLVLAIVAHPPLTIADGLASRLGDVPGTSGVWEAALGYGAIQIGFAVIALAALRRAISSP